MVESPSAGFRTLLRPGTGAPQSDMHNIMLFFCNLASTFLLEGVNNAMVSIATAKATQRLPGKCYYSIHTCCRKSVRYPQLQLEQAADSKMMESQPGTSCVMARNEIYNSQQALSSPNSPFTPFVFRLFDCNSSLLGRRGDQRNNPDRANAEEGRRRELLAHWPTRGARYPTAAA